MAYANDPTGQARKARTLTATDPATGATVTRTTDRVYVAAVVTDDLKGRTYAVAWAGRPDLAEKALAKRGGAAHGYRLAPVTSDPWGPFGLSLPTAAAPAAAAPAAAVTPEPTGALTPAAAAALEARLWASEEAAALAAPTPEPQTAARARFADGVTPATVDGMAAHIRGLGRPATPEPATPDPLAAAAAELVAALAGGPALEPLNPAGGLRLMEFRTATPGRPYLAGDGVTLWAFETEALARAAAGLIAATGAEPYLAGPGPLGRPVPLPLEPAAARVTLPGEPAAPAPVTPAGPAPTLPTLEPVAAARAATRALEAAAPPAGSGVAAHRAAAAAGRPVSLAALARDLGRGLGLATGGRIPGPAAPLNGDSMRGQPWDPGTPAARARVAEQGRRAAILWPVAQAITGAGHPLPPSWWSDGPVLNGEVGPVTALAALPAALLESAAAALAALPPVTPAQAQALELVRDALAR